MNMQYDYKCDSAFPKHQMRFWTIFLRKKDLGFTAYSTPPR